jgi:hypothetical protein
METFMCFLFFISYYNKVHMQAWQGSNSKMQAQFGVISTICILIQNKNNNGLTKDSEFAHTSAFKNFRPSDEQL